MAAKNRNVIGLVARIRFPTAVAMRFVLSSLGGAKKIQLPPAKMMIFVGKDLSIYSRDATERKAVVSWLYDCQARETILDWLDLQPAAQQWWAMNNNESLSFSINCSRSWVFAFYRDAILYEED